MGYDKVIAEIDAQIKQLEAARNALLGLDSGLRSSGRKGRRKMSASARKRIAAAQRARWAKWKKQHKKG
jgi:low affinity Fe/Cu permease